MSVTRLDTSWLGFDQDTEKLFFWDGRSYRPLEEAAGYATTGEVESLANLVAGKVDKTGDTMSGVLGAAGFSTTGTVEATLFELGATRLSGDGDELYVWAFKVWHQGNDGAGSGLDADQLDGHDSGYFTDIAARLGYTPANTEGQTFSGAIGAPQITLGTSPASRTLTADASGVYVDGSKLWTEGNAPAGRLKSIRTYIEDAVWENPGDVRLLLVYGWGAGGGGGGAEGGANKGACGAGGGGGGFGWKLIDVSEVASVEVTIGEPGAGGSTAGGDGGDGGATFFGGYLSATGGIGGSGQAAGNFAQIVQGGSGGTASGGDFNVTGTAGRPGIRLDYQNGIAGAGAPAALLGGGGNGFAGNTDGQNGYARGDGGGGGVVSNNATGHAGGDGGSGMIWLWEFA